MLDYEHDGGGCPVEVAKVVRVEFRNGTIAKDDLAAGAWRWKWGHPFRQNDSHDIVSYSLVNEPRADQQTWTPTSGGYS